MENFTGFWSQWLRPSAGLVTLQWSLLLALATISGSLCQRYIELNPVRAGMTDDPAHYRWSSYRSNGLGQADALLTPHDLYLALDGDAANRQAVYRFLFRSELDREAVADIRLALEQGQPLGKGRFLDQIERMIGRRCEVRPRGRPRKMALPDDMQQDNRGQ